MWFYSTSLLWAPQWGINSISWPEGEFHSPPVQKLQKALDSFTESFFMYLFIFLGSKITADGDCCHEIKRCLLLGRKAMTNLYSMLKIKNTTWPRNAHIVKATVLPVVMYKCETWTIKKTECRRINAFKLWCWRRLLRVPWTARKSHQSILKEIVPEYSLEGLVLKLNLQYSGRLM